jgi:hypothetical protein
MHAECHLHWRLLLLLLLLLYLLQATAASAALPVGLQVTVKAAGCCCLLHNRLHAPVQAQGLGVFAQLLTLADLL